MNQYVLAFFKWVAGFFQEVGTGESSSKRLNNIAAMFAVLFVLLIVASFFCGIAWALRNSPNALQVLEVLKDLIEWIVTAAIGGGTVSYLGGKKSEAANQPGATAPKPDGDT